MRQKEETICFASDVLSVAIEEETLCSLVHLGADSRAVVVSWQNGERRGRSLLFLPLVAVEVQHSFNEALLLHDLDECLQQPWAVVAKVGELSLAHLRSGVARSLGLHQVPRTWRGSG